MYTVVITYSSLEYVRTTVLTTKHGEDDILNFCTVRVYVYCTILCDNVTSFATMCCLKMREFSLLLLATKTTYLIYGFPSTVANEPRERLTTQIGPILYTMVF